MADMKQFNLRWLGCICLGVASGAIIIGLAVSPNQGALVSIKLTAGTNGTPRLLGLSLANTNLRDGVFNTMGRMGMKAELLAPWFQANATDAQSSNLVETFEAMQRAGLVRAGSPASRPLTNSYVSEPSRPGKISPLLGMPNPPTSGDPAAWQAYFARMRSRPCATFDDVNPPTRMGLDSLRR